MNSDINNIFFLSPKGQDKKKMIVIRHINSLIKPGDIIGNGRVEARPE